MAIFSISLRLLIPLKGVLKRVPSAHFSGHVIFLQRLITKQSNMAAKRRPHLRGGWVLRYDAEYGDKPVSPFFSE